jgi:hypothetical protein
METIPESALKKEIPSWIEEFRRSGPGKRQRYDKLSQSDKELLSSVLVQPRLTKDRVKQSMKYRDPKSTPVGRLGDASIEFCRNRPVADLIKLIQIFDDCPRVNLDQIGMSMDDVVKYFEYGVFGGFADNIHTLPISAVNAWLFGASLDEMLTPVDEYYPNNLTGVMNLDQWKIFASHIPWKYLDPTGMPTLTYSNFQKSMEGKMIVEPVSLNNPDLFPERSRDRFTRIRILLEEVSKQGLIFDDPLPVYHFNHIQVLDSCETYIPIHITSIDINGVRYAAPDNDFRQSQLVKYLKWVRVCPRFAYPRFRTRMWTTYPKPLQKIIFSLLCTSRLRSNSFLVGRDVTLNVILDYVVFNFYVDAEEHLKSLLTIRDQYSRLRKPALRMQAMDCGIVLPYGSVEVDIRQVSYRLAIFHFGYPRATDAEADFVREAIKYVIDWKHIQKSLPDLANWRKKSHGVYRKFMNAVSNLLRECYHNEIALSLLKNGDIKLSEGGHIADMKMAKKLSRARRRDYLTHFIKMRDCKDENNAKRLRRSSRLSHIGEDDDVDD